jgi:hypothetical protein
MNSEHAINFKILLQTWLSEMDWRGDIEEKNGNIQLKTAVRFDNQYYDVYIDASNRSECVRVCVYSPFHVRATNLSETLLLINKINVYLRGGRFAVINDNRIQYSHYVDFETTNPTVQSIHLMMALALNNCANYDDALASVAVGGRSAEEALAAMDAAESEETPGPVVPEVTSESTMSSALH